MRTLLSASVLFTASMAAPLVASAQAENDAPAEARAAEKAPDGKAADDTATRLQALEKQMADLQEQNKALAGQLSEVQETQNQGGSEPPSDLGKTKIFGFFDMSFGRTMFSKKDTIFKASLPVTDKSTFMLSSLNVYLGNQITEKLKFLSELRFTYQPLGNETSTQTYAVMPNGQTLDLGNKYTRTDTSVTDPTSMQTYRLGGVSMERVQVTYAFNDYFGVTAGRFLTPYGIWNVDHGSPVILMVRAPIMQTQQVVPTQQLGIQLFGRAFLGGNLSLDYAGTVSNGRGPIDTIEDLDENKGLGLRWRLNYDADNFSVSLGQYGYTGKYTDVSKSLTFGPGSADYRASVDTTNQYTEYVLANDLLIKIFGLRLQSEATFRRVSYNVPPKLDASNFNGNPAIAGQYNAPNYYSHAFYGLAAYELPEAWTTRKLRVTPFLYYEKFNLNDTVVNNSQASIAAVGINTRPYPGLVVKLEYDYVKFADSVDIMPDGSSHNINNGTITGAFCQLAVTY